MKKTNLLRTRHAKESFVGTFGIGGALIALGLAGNTYWMGIFVIVAIYSIAAVGLNILKESGQFSFGQGAIFGASAYGTALAAAAGVPLVFAMVLGVLAACTLGILLALPGFRVQGFYLGFVTLCGALVFPDLLYAFDHYTQAVAGLSVRVPSLNTPLVGAITPLTIIVIICLAAALLVHAYIRTTTWCRQMKMTDVSPEATMALGVSPGKIRVSAFVVASIFGGVAGALYVPHAQYVGPGAFPVTLSILLYFAVVVGGEGTVLGPVLGLAVLYIIPDALLTGLLDYRLIVYGVITFLLLAILPDGILPSAERFVSERILKHRPGQSTIQSVITDLGKLGNRPDESGTKAATVAGAAVQVVDISKSFGAVQALRNVSFEIRPGTIHGLIGPNGCGKSTLLNVISGFITPDEGHVLIDGEDVAHLLPSQRARIGIGRTFQTPRLAESFSVWENLNITAEQKTSQLMIDILDSNRHEFEQAQVKSLPHAHRRIVETLRALGGAERLILLDEPAGGLSAKEREAFADLIRSLVRETGISVLIVEHDLNLVWNLADTVSLMSEGQILETGNVQDIQNAETLSVLVGGKRAEG